MNEKHTPYIGKMKAFIGSFTLLAVFLTPYLNITQFSLSTTLLQNALISLLFLSFWVVAIYLLRKPQQMIRILKRNTQNYSRQKTTLHL